MVILGMQPVSECIYMVILGMQPVLSECFFHLSPTPLNQPLYM